MRSILIILLVAILSNSSFAIKLNNHQYTNTFLQKPILGELEQRKCESYKSYILNQNLQCFPNNTNYQILKDGYKNYFLNKETYGSILTRPLKLGTEDEGVWIKQ